MCLLACSRYNLSLICMARSGSDQWDSVALAASRTIFSLCFSCVLTHGTWSSSSTEVSVVSFVGDRSFGFYSLTRSDLGEEF